MPGDFVRSHPGRALGRRDVLGEDGYALRRRIIRSFAADLLAVAGCEFRSFRQTVFVAQEFDRRRTFSTGEHFIDGSAQAEAIGVRFAIGARLFAHLAFEFAICGAVVALSALAGERGALGRRQVGVGEFGDFAGIEHALALAIECPAIPGRGFDLLRIKNDIGIGGARITPAAESGVVVADVQDNHAVAAFAARLVDDVTRLSARLRLAPRLAAAVNDQGVFEV
ncbi:MAG: hypothetical protein ACREPX_03440 [Rhodanobacteraceae bacterium]